ncbi:MAG: ABC transporter ATP-binding protein [Bacillota bacterium]
MNAIEVRGLSVSIKEDDRLLLDCVDLTIAKGECVGLVGLSGCGKSVLAKSIAGIIPTLIPLELQGEILLFGKKVSELSPLEKIETIGYVFQNADNQMVSSEVEAELAFGGENLCLPVEEIERRISKTLEQLNMTAYRFANTNALSGGQKQLIALGSILTLQPNILICDEILCQLDEESVARVVEILKKLRATGITILIIEHDLKKLEFADEIYVIKEQKLTRFEGELE